MPAWLQFRAMLAACAPSDRFLVCRYARSLGLAARQFTPAIGAAFYYPISTSYQLQPSFHTSWTEPEPTARARNGTRSPAYGEAPGGPLFGPSNLNGRCDRSGPGMSVRHSCHFLRTQRDFEASVIDILANSKIRLNSVKRMNQIQNTS